MLAEEVNVMGRADGSIYATENINISETATVKGALGAPSVGIEEEASFRGQIDINIPLKKVIRRLKPRKRPMRVLKRWLRQSIMAMRADAELG